MGMEAGIKSDREREQPPLWGCWTSSEVDSATREHQQGDLTQPQTKPCSLWGALCLLVPLLFSPFLRGSCCRGASLDDPSLLSLVSVGKFVLSSAHTQARQK